MKRKGFTLIEIVSSLLIFAAGGTMALSVFNYNAGCRVEILERMEAFDLASGLLNTLVLRSQTDPDWKYSNTEIPKDILPKNGYQDIPIQKLDNHSDPTKKNNSLNQDGAANFLKSEYSGTTWKSGYQWRFCLAKADSSNPMKIKRNKIHYRTFSDPIPEDVSTYDFYILQVEVSWPRDEKSDEEAIAAGETPKRKKVLLNTVVSCPL